MDDDANDTLDEMDNLLNFMKMLLKIDGVKQKKQSNLDSFHPPPPPPPPLFPPPLIHSTTYLPSQKQQQQQSTRGTMASQSSSSGRNLNKHYQSLRGRFGSGRSGANVPQVSVRISESSSMKKQQQSSQPFKFSFKIFDADDGEDEDGGEGDDEDGDRSDTDSTHTTHVFGGVEAKSGKTSHRSPSAFKQNRTPSSSSTATIKRKFRNFSTRKSSARMQQQTRSKQRATAGRGGRRSRCNLLEAEMSKAGKDIAECVRKQREWSGKMHEERTKLIDGIVQLRARLLDTINRELQRFDSNEQRTNASIKTTETGNVNEKSSSVNSAEVMIPKG